MQALRLGRKRIIVVLFIAAQVLSGGCDRSATPGVRGEPVPPVAEKHPHELEVHGDRRIDNYYWIRDDQRSDPGVLAYLGAENAYTKAVLAHTEPLQAKLFGEITGRLKSEDRTVPVKRDDYLYFREYRAGGEYPVYLRQPAAGGGEPEVILDGNALARGHPYYAIGDWAVSSGQDHLAYAEDTRSRRQYTIRFRNLTSRTMLADAIVDTSGDMAWANDNRTLFYVARDPETLLPYRVFRHRLGEDPAQDVLVYEEKDNTFYTSVYKTRSRRFIVIFLGSTLSTEALLIDADRPDSAPVSFLPREPRHEYEIRHIDDTFYVRTNWRAENFRLMKVKEGMSRDKANWVEVVPNRDDVLLFDVEVFRNFVALNEREKGLTQLTVLDRRTGQKRRLDFIDPAYSVSLGANPEIETNELRYNYTSLRIPDSVYEEAMDTGYRTLLKQDEVVGRFDPSEYATKRAWATARDGTKIPISIVYRRSLWRPGGNPLYVYGYGSYGISIDPEFASDRLSLLDRGFVYAIVHVRGGEEMGRHWYEAGKMLHKKNTFYDFIDGTKYLLAHGYGDPGKVFAAGGSAGGLLMGVIANEAPLLYTGGVIAHVPFVDIVTTMLDETIPLTTGEFDEWGNPQIKEQYDYILSYSPYDQVRDQAYPNMFVTTGLYDSQVQYYEPVKWVAKLRAHQQGGHRILLHIDMQTGHSGASGRYERYRLKAMEYAFILDVIGIGS